MFYNEPCNKTSLRTGSQRRGQKKISERSDWERSLSSPDKGGKRLGGETGSPLLHGPMCDAEKDWTSTKTRFKLPVQLMAAKISLDEPEMKCSFFHSLFLSHQYRINKGLFDIFGPQLNIILSVRISLFKSIFVVSWSHLSEIRQWLMQECPAYHDQVVFQILYMLKINSVFITLQIISWIYWDIAAFQNF